MKKRVVTVLGTLFLLVGVAGTSYFQFFVSEDDPYRYSRRKMCALSSLVGIALIAYAGRLKGKPLPAVAKQFVAHGIDRDSRKTRSRVIPEATSEADARDKAEKLGIEVERIEVR